MGGRGGAEWVEGVELCGWRGWSCKGGGSGAVWMEVVELCGWRRWSCVDGRRGAVWMLVVELLRGRFIEIHWEYWRQYLAA